MLRVIRGVRHMLGRQLGLAEIAKSRTEAMNFSLFLSLEMQILSQNCLITGKFDKVQRRPSVLIWGVGHMRCL